MLQDDDIMFYQLLIRKNFDLDEKLNWKKRFNTSDLFLITTPD